MRYTMYLGGCGSGNRTFICGRINGDIDLSADKRDVNETHDVDVLAKAGPGDKVDLFSQTIFTALQFDDIEALRIYCLATDKNTVKEAVERIECDTPIDVIAGSLVDMSYTAQCRLMSKLAEQERANYNNTPNITIG